MNARPAWWLVLAALAALAVVVPLRGHRARPTHAAPVAKELPSAAPPAVVERAVEAGVDAGPPVPSEWPSNVTSVLHVGDSSLGFAQGLAQEMTARFAAIGVRYEAHTEASAGLHSFASSKKLEELVRTKHPDVVLVTLGMNNLTVPHPEEYEVDVRSLVAQAGERPCWWVGPLSIKRPEQGLLSMLARTTAPCRWTSSYELEIERQPDGIHPTQRGAARWADAIWSALGLPPPRAP